MCLFHQTFISRVIQQTQQRFPQVVPCGAWRLQLALLWNPQETPMRASPGSLRWTVWSDHKWLKDKQINGRTSLAGKQSACGGRSGDDLCPKSHPLSMFAVAPQHCPCSDRCKAHAVQASASSPANECNAKVILSSQKTGDSSLCCKAYSQYLMQLGCSKFMAVLNRRWPLKERLGQQYTTLLKGSLEGEEPAWPEVWAGGADGGLGKEEACGPGRHVTIRAWQQPPPQGIVIIRVKRGLGGLKSGSQGHTGLPVSILQPGPHFGCRNMQWWRSWLLAAS